MMSKKQLTAMLALHITYLLLGATIFTHIEGPLESQERLKAKLELLEIQDLLSQYYEDQTGQKDILGKLSDYCGRSMFNDSSEIDQQGPVKWDFYHSFFFSYTVVSTIGYGNLAPSTSLSRLLMILYGLFGIPIQGILLANMAEYFGQKIINVYKSYKLKNKLTASKIDGEVRKIGLIGQIVLYLIPGFLFFIFLPAILFVIFEEWDYVESIYYAFVTLTTIGFGDIVAGTANRGFAHAYFVAYQIFLIVWITFGLGYLVMLLGFITSAMRSEKIHKLEHKLARNLKATQSKLLHGFSKDVSFLRRIINEAYLMKFKPVYVEVNTPCLHRSKSCPDFTYHKEICDSPTPKRKRANSENIYLSTSRILQRIQSDTDLLGIDKDRTFTASAIIQPAQLLARVVDALGSFKEEDSDASDTEGVKLFSEDEILATEKPLHQSGWSVGEEKIIPPSPIVRHRTSSLIPIPGFIMLPEVNDYPWSKPTTNETLNPYTYGRQFGKLSLPNGDNMQSSDKMLKEFTHTRTNLFSKLNPFKRIRLNSMTSKSTNESANEKAAVEDYYKQTSRGRSSMMTHNEHENYMKKTAKGRSSILSLPGREQSDVLEHTSVADLIRALAALHDVTDDQVPKRKPGTDGLAHSPTSITPPKMDSLTASQQRRFSMRVEMPPEHEDRHSVIPSGARRRRLSVRSGGLLPMSHAPAVAMTENNINQRRASLLLPPPYTPLEVLETTSAGQLPRHRRFSPGLQPSSGQMARRLSKSPVSSLRTNILPSGDVTGLEPSSAIPRNIVDRVKRDSLTDVFINK